MNGNSRIALVAFVSVVLDQISKMLVLAYMPVPAERTLINGFFKLVHWQNTGAAWSMFSGNNAALAIVSLLALLALFVFRHHFETRTPLGQISMGLIFGGIIGNVLDRLFRHHVVDFIRFFIVSRSGEELGFPAFNIADSAICVGVGLLFIISLRGEQSTAAPNAGAT
ncbi:MAG: lipoprotein signal peptidase [Verrucomicrobiales bacterium]|nr:lipoprotein signal peptidase [Verrucomicrobiales bacterium]MDB6129252.1 lipoprotein signal peptidase [Verrucomicrobiales bacterium]